MARMGRARRCHDVCTVREERFQSRKPAHRPNQYLPTTESVCRRNSLPHGPLTLSISFAQKCSPRSHVNNYIQHKHNMAFSFGFSGDDIEEDPNDVAPQTEEQSTPGDDVPPPIAARAHDLDELVCR